jgi:hypothetical protein
MSTVPLTLADLFLVGLALDISGAILLAKGLLLAPRTLSQLNTWWGVGYGQHEDRCRNRVAGEFGVLYLVVGFALQAVGYSLAIAGVPTETGILHLAVGSIMVLGVLGLTWLAWTSLSEQRISALEEAIAREQPTAKQEIPDAHVASEEDKSASS